MQAAFKQQRRHVNNPGLVSGVFAFFMVLLAFGCGKSPVQSLRAADEAVARAQIIATTAQCREKVTSAEQALARARQAMEEKAYEKAKTEIFQTLRITNEVRQCSENQENSESQSDEKPGG